jgi:hypothetical protein
MRDALSPVGRAPMPLGGGVLELALGQVPVEVGSLLGQSQPGQLIECPHREPPERPFHLPIVRHPSNAGYLTATVRISVDQDR